MKFQQQKQNEVKLKQMLQEKRNEIENRNKMRYDYHNKLTLEEQQLQESRKSKAEQKEQELLTKLRQTMQT